MDIYNGESNEEKFAYYCYFLESNLHTFEYVLNWVIESGYDQDLFLKFYHNQLEKINERKKWWRRFNWQKVLKKVAYSSDVPSLNINELYYCMKYFDYNEIEYIMSEIYCDNNISLTDEETKDPRHIAKALVEESISELLNEALTHNGHISYKEDITTLFYEYPFLEDEQLIMFKYLEDQGVIIDGKPEKSSLLKQSRAKYFTDVERIKARKQTRSKYRKKKNLPNLHSIVDTLKYAEKGRFDEWEFDQELDITKYIKEH